LDVFKTHGKIYEASAAQMFKVPVDSIKKGDLLRQKGKIAELALGYGGGPNALVKMGALEMGLDETELPKLVKMWRNANQQITALWTNVEETALAACRGQKQLLMFGLDIQLADNVLLVTLPSGRPICYFNPHTDTNKYGRTALHYDGMNQVTRKWEDTETYGGKLVENIIQAIARDCLAVSMLRLHEGGYKIVGHVHDEIILEVPDANNNALRSVCDIMALPIDWAPGLPLRADGFESDYYRKD
jgi:DNA polymerase